VRSICLSPGGKAPESVKSTSKRKEVGNEKREQRQMGKGWAVEEKKRSTEVYREAIKRKAGN